jgi:hypothetical protein
MLVGDSNVTEGAKNIGKNLTEVAKKLGETISKKLHDLAKESTFYHNS